VYDLRCIHGPVVRAPFPGDGEHCSMFRLTSPFRTFK
jgi:hypothetical protein